jgi:hypothetical protein
MPRRPGLSCRSWACPPEASPLCVRPLASLPPCGSPTARGPFHTPALTGAGPTRPRAPAGGARGVNTWAINARSSSSEGNRGAWPDTICSTRPCSASGVSAVPSRSCTTHAQWGESGALGGGSGVIGTSIAHAAMIGRRSQSVLRLQHRHSIRLPDHVREMPSAWSVPRQAVAVRLGRPQTAPMAQSCTSWSTCGPQAD